MADILTSNELTGLYGQPPSKTIKDTELFRGFVIYLEVFSQGGQGIFARTFYKDFQTGSIDEQKYFELEVIHKAPNFDPAPKPGDPMEVFPSTLSDDIRSIDFGWEPCRVSYILKSDYAAFVSPNPEDEYIQPIVFRRNKVVIADDETTDIKTYRPNHSFFNLEYDSVQGCSVLRFDNLMLINAAGDALGATPTDESEKAKKRYDYCMDIHIRVSQTKMQNLAAGKVDAVAGLIDLRSIERAITIVFDPPQTNGGSSGPPDP